MGVCIAAHAAAIARLMSEVPLIFVRFAIGKMTVKMTTMPMRFVAARITS